MKIRITRKDCAAGKHATAKRADDKARRIITDFNMRRMKEGQS